MTQESENISRIRDILMGNNFAEFERKIEQSEIVLREANQLLENHFNRQLSDIRQQIEDLRQEQINHIQQLKSEWVVLHEKFQEQLQQIEQKAVDLSASTENMIGETRQWMTKKSEQQTEAQQQQLLDFRNHLSTQLLELQQTKLDGSKLAVLLSEIALQISKKPVD